MAVDFNLGSVNSAAAAASVTNGTLCCRPRRCCMVGEFKTVRKGHEMTNRKMFFTMLWGAVFRRRSRAVMAVIASMVGAATLFCLAATCIAVPQQMNEEMRAYGANLIVTPSESAEKSHGIDTDTVKALNQMVKGSYSARSAAYRYESVRINSAPYTLAGITTKDVKALNHHWNVTGDWPSEGNVMLGRDVADALGVSIGSTVTIGYRASDDAQDSGALSQTEAQAKENGRVSSDIMENTGTEFRVGASSIRAAAKTKSSTRSTLTWPNWPVPNAART